MRTCHRPLLVLLLLCSAFANRGCFLTHSLWQWASLPVPRSQLLGIQAGELGQVQATFYLKDCKDLADGYYALLTMAWPFSS